MEMKKVWTEVFFFLQTHTFTFSSRGVFVPTQTSCCAHSRGVAAIWNRSKLSSKYSHTVPLVLTSPSNRSHVLSRTNTVCSGQFKVQHHAQRRFPPEFHKLRLYREAYVPRVRDGAAGAARSQENQHITGEPRDQLLEGPTSGPNPGRKRW